MPFRSKAQMRKMAMLMKQGKITKEKFDEWAHSTNMKSLPEHVKPKPKPKKKVVKKKR